MAFSAVSSVEGFQKQAGAPSQAWRKGRREQNEKQSASEKEMLDELCAYIASEGGELRADRVAQFYQSKPLTYKQYFMREGLRNIVNRSGRLTWDPRDFIKLNHDAAVLPKNMLTLKAASEGLQKKGSQLIHTGAYCVVRKHSTMGCAVVGFGSEELVGCILGEAPHLSIMNTTVHISPHVDTNAGTGFTACSIFAAWGPDAESMSPIPVQLLGTYLDAMVLRFLSSALATQMSNPDLACVRSLVHYIAANCPAEREMSVNRVEEFTRHNPEYRPILHRRIKALCDCYPQWMMWWQQPQKDCVIRLGWVAIEKEFGEQVVHDSLDTYCSDGPFGQPCSVGYDMAWVGHASPGFAKETG